MPIIEVEHYVHRIDHFCWKMLLWWLEVHRGILKWSQTHPRYVLLPLPQQPKYNNSIFSRKAPNFLQAFYCTEKSKVTYHLKTPRIGLFVPSVCHGEWLHRTEPMCVGCDHHHITVHAIIIQKVVIATFWDFQSARWPACGPVPVVAHYRINTKELLPELTMKSSWRS